MGDERTLVFSCFKMVESLGYFAAKKGAVCKMTCSILFC